MKVKLFKFFLLLFLITTCKNDSTEKPNIIIFLSDDQGWGDLNLNGNPNLNTPNIDGIAMEPFRGFMLVQLFSYKS